VHQQADAHAYPGQNQQVHAGGRVGRPQPPLKELERTHVGRSDDATDRSYGHHQEEESDAGTDKGLDEESRRTEARHELDRATNIVLRSNFRRVICRQRLQDVVADAIGAPVQLVNPSAGAGDILRG